MTTTTPKTAHPEPTMPGGVRLILHAEGAALLAAATAGYGWAGADWGIFALLFLAPDVFMLGYLRGPRIGAAVYNIGHTTVLPGALLLGGLAAAMPLATAVALIWLAHIGFDRMLGYGLKRATGFRDTHLG